LSIDLDNGPETASSRTQFMKRLVEFSDRHQLTLELAYYPPYHSKYNLIERCWGILENHWNGTLLTSIQTALEWAKSMTWRGVTPIVHLMDRVYETGVRLLPQTSAQSPRACNDRRPSPNGASSSILKLGRPFPAGCPRHSGPPLGGASLRVGRQRF
jgi:Rhodopirellula transposase DDE domain